MEPETLGQTTGIVLSLAMQGTLVMFLVEIAKYIVQKTHNVKLAKSVIIVLTAIAAVLWALAGRYGTPSWALEAFEVFAAATTVYASIWKYIKEPIKNTLTSAFN